MPDAGDRSRCRARQPHGGARAPARRARRADRGPRPDDLRLAGGRREPRLRAAARPRAPGALAGRAASGRERRSESSTRDLRRRARAAASRSRRSGWRPSRGRRRASTAPARALGDGRGTAAAAARARPRRRRDAPLVSLEDVRRRRGESRRRGDPDAARAVRDRGAGRAGRVAPEGRVAPADRRVQDPRRVPRDRVAHAGRTGARRRDPLLGQPCPGRRARGAAARVRGPSS